VQNFSMREPKVETLSERAKAGEPGAMVELGRRLLMGDGVAPSIPDGARHLLSAASLGSGEACAQLAVLAALGVHFEQDWTQAFDFLRRAAMLGSERAQRELALLTGVSRDKTGAGGAIDVRSLTAPRRLEKVHDRPRIWITRAFLSVEECQWIIELGRPMLGRAEVYARATHEAGVGDERTNSAAAFNVTNVGVALAVLHARMAATIGIPAGLLTPPTLLHYSPGQEFKPHYDFFEPAPNTDSTGQFAQRTATLLFYLNADYDGGETDFPRVPYRFRGAAGDGLIFANINPSGAPDHATLHAGLPPTRGEKWLLSQWAFAPLLN